VSNVEFISDRKGTLFVIPCHNDATLPLLFRLIITGYALT